MEQCVKTGPAIRGARQEELVALGCHQPLILWVQQGHCLGIQQPPQEPSLGSSGCVRGASHLASGCTLLRRWARLAGFGCRWQRRALRFVLILTQGQQPWQQWAGTAQGGHWLHQHRLKVAIGNAPAQSLWAVGGTAVSECLCVPLEQGVNTAPALDGTCFQSYSSVQVMVLPF